MKIGILGVGHLGAALARGFARAGLSDEVLLSPRSHEVSRRLHEELHLRVAENNEDLVRNSDLVIVATRPHDVLKTIRMLPWQEGHIVVCAAAGITLGDLRGAVVPAQAARAMPVMASALNESAIPLCPALPSAIAALSPLGRIILAENEENFATLSSLGAWFGWLFALADATSKSLEVEGVPIRTARKATADMMRAAGAMISNDPDLSPEDVLKSLATPGGITEVGLKALEGSNAMDPWQDALVAAIKRLQELGGPDGA